MSEEAKPKQTAKKYPLVKTISQRIYQNEAGELFYLRAWHGGQFILEPLPDGVTEKDLPAVGE